MAVNTETYMGGVLNVSCDKCGARPLQRCMSASGVQANAHKTRMELAGMATKGKTTHKWTADDPKQGMGMDELRAVVGEMSGLQSGDARVKAGITLGGRLQWLSVEVDIKPLTAADTLQDA